MLKQLMIAATLGLTLSAMAVAETTPDALVRKMASEVIDTVKTDAAIQNGDVGRIIALVDDKVMPNVDFQRMTSSAVGRFWRSATPHRGSR